MVITVLQSCSLIDLAIKLNFRHKVDDPHPLEWEPPSFQWGSSALQELLRDRSIWIYCTPPDPNASIRIPTWAIIMAISGIETLMQLSLLNEANFKAAKSLITWE